MASRLSESAALVERCRKAGWRVEQTRAGSGWKVWNPAGAVKVIHGSYSDVNASDSVLRDLEKLGLTDDEQRIKSMRLTESRTRTQAAREAADRKAKEMAAQTSVKKAAGPYLTVPDDCDLEWLTYAHPAPWARWMTITPKAAAYILEHHNADNRPLTEKDALHYRNVILAGRWKLTHQGLAFDTRGTCQDAQHRLRAIALAGDADPEFDGVPFLVCVGMPVDNFSAIDEGKLRTAAQLFARGGQEKNRLTLQALVRLVHYFNESNPRGATRTRLPNSVVIDEFDADADAFRDAAHLGQSHCRKILSGPGALSAAYYLLYKTNGEENAYVEAFFTGLTSGVKPGTRILLDDHDPRAVLRRRLKNMQDRGERYTALTQLGMILTTWNNCVMSRTPSVIKFGEDSPLPEILRCTPGEGAPPQAFREVDA